LVRFLIDAQLPPKLSRALIDAGHLAEHVEDAGLRHATDAEIWAHALRTGAAILTKDEDFVDRTRRQSGGPIVVWLRIGNSSNSALLAWLLPVLPAVDNRIQNGDRFIEVR
jgi:predicted nuclease of predicted toxin-antitoxin system